MTNTIQPQSELTRVELLAPAGNEEALRAAVENGADGVYFGIDNFNARLRAKNFRIEDLRRIVSWLHERGVRAYVTLNTLIFPAELEEVSHILLKCSQAGVDGVMVQDLGVAFLAAHLVPELPIHASTQMTITAPESAKALEELGIRVTRIVAPRELDISQIADLVRETGREIEVFVHGALCVAYSGQCLTSEALGGRSANRGECAQACRLPFDLIVDGKQQPLGDVRYLLSPKDLAAYSDIPRLIRIGVKSLKIEGRMKNALYVAATVQAYREALDSTLRARNAPAELPLNEDTRYRLEMTFTRGFTRGYLHSINHQEVVEGRFSKKRGPCIGTVLKVRRRDVLARVFAPLTLGDGVVIGNFDREEELGGRVYGISVENEKVKTVTAKPEKPLTVGLCLSSEKFDGRLVRPGDLIWKTSDPRLEKELAQSYSPQVIHCRKPLKARLHLQVGMPPRLTLTDDWGISVTVEGEGTCEEAQQHTLTPEIARDYLGRLGDTPFYLETLEMEQEGKIYLPFSRLNALRRKAVEALLEKKREVGCNRRSNPDALNQLRRAFEEQRGIQDATSVQLNVLCRTMEQVRIAAAHPHVHTIYTDFEDPRFHGEAARIIRENGKRYVPATLRVMKPREHNLLRAILQEEPDAVLVRNLAAWYVLRHSYPAVSCIGDYSLNVANELASWLLIKSGCEYFVPSYDLNGDQLLDLLRKIPPHWVEVTIHQHIPMFHMEHCVFCRFLSTGTDYTNCGRPCDRHRVALRDRMQYLHPVKADAGCRNTVYNAVPQSAAEYVPRLLAAGVRRFRIEFIEEDSVDTTKAINAYSELLEGKLDSASVWRQLKAMSRMGVTRGTLDHD